MFYACGRHPAVFRVKTGAKKDGTITAMDMWVADHTGAYAVIGEGIMALECGFYLSMYRCQNMRAIGHTVYTNTPPRTAMRGAGNPQQTFTCEVHMDAVAEKIGMDPVEFRLKNHVRLGERFYGQGPDVVCVIQKNS
jgi:CO/xanthine dehydrogenase Mo-binding subunit